MNLQIYPAEECLFTVRVAKPVQTSHCEKKTQFIFGTKEPRCKMTDNMKPVRCGCGGEAVIKCLPKDSKPYLIYCDKCFTASWCYPTETEAIMAWNRAMSERSAKGIEHDASITDTDGNKYFRTEYLCGACKKKVLGGDEYCSHCGCRLDWNEDIPMEYFESGGI